MKKILYKPPRIYQKYYYDISLMTESHSFFIISRKQVFKIFEIIQVCNLHIKNFQLWKTLNSCRWFFIINTISIKSIVKALANGYYCFLSINVLENFYKIGSSEHSMYKTFMMQCYWFKISFSQKILAKQ